MATAAAALPLGAVAHSFAVEPSWLAARHVQLGSSTRVHRLVHFTDVHYRGDRAYLEKVVAAINALEPNLVCFTGDLVEDAEFVPEALEVLRLVRAPLFGVPGNHDYWAKVDFDTIAESFARTGGKWLMDESALTCQGAVNVIGATCNHSPAVAPVPGVKNVLLFHYPAWAEKLSGVRLDVMLAGHSHGGQVRLPGYGPLLVPFGVHRFDRGLYQTISGPLYVNPGIGYFYCNVRFCCRPEVTLIEI